MMARDRREYMKKWYLEHREEALKAAKERPKTPKDPEKVRAANKRFREKNPGYKKQWRTANPEKTRQQALKDARKRLSMPEATRPEPEHCESCGRLFFDTPHLDHCHTTGVFRGWLCRPCNLGLGMLGDDIASVEKILAYLKRAYASS